MPQPEWTMFSQRTNFHGRQVCFARKPNCAGCLLAEVCPKIGFEKERGTKKPGAAEKANRGALRPAKRRGAKS